MMANSKPRDDLYYFQWEVSDAKTLQKMLKAGKITLEQIGELFLAVMNYVDQVEVEVSPELLFIYTSFQTRIDSKREARVKLGVSRAQSGRNGGLAKAANAAAQKAAHKSKFKPPTRKQFQEAMQRLSDNDEIHDLDEIENYDIDVLYEKLSDANWTIDGEPIHSRGDWEDLLSAKFPFASSIPSHVYYQIFRHIFSVYHGLRDSDEHSSAFNATAEFDDLYDANTRSWTIQGEVFKASQWKEAVDLYITTKYPEACPP